MYIKNKYILRGSWNGPAIMMVCARNCTSSKSKWERAAATYSPYSPRCWRCNNHCFRSKCDLLDAPSSTRRRGHHHRTPTAHSVCGWLTDRGREYTAPFPSYIYFLSIICVLCVSCIVRFFHPKLFEALSCWLIALMLLLCTHEVVPTTRHYS